PLPGDSGVKIKKRLFRQPRFVCSKTLQTINSAGTKSLFKNEPFISGAIGNINPETLKPVNP
ncbi:MAG TPA: hypothetical protein PLT59_10145, partial [Bacteroidales bacterium]|nr:hypothetical protein [Bacteroidales bacterium]